jgi:hypothetical protein
MDYNRMDLENERSSVRDKLWAWDSRLLPAIAVVLILMMIDFFNRIVIFLPDTSGQRVEEIATVSGAVPQIGQPHLDNYLLKLANLVKVPSYAEADESIDNVGDQLPIEPIDGYWDAGVFSYKLIALVENAERFALINSIDNESGANELIKLRRGDTVERYRVTELLSKKLRLVSNTGDEVTLMLFESEEPHN